MNKIYLDFETYYSKKDFSLKKMSTQDYVTDPQFQVIGCAIAIDDASAVWYAGDAVKAALQAIDWSDAMVIAHDSAFDALILHYIYNVQPAYIACTMNMARASGAFIPDGASLAKLAKAAQDAGHALPSKGNEVIAADGMRLEHFSPAQLEAYASYCRTDVEICRDLYKILRDRVSTGEMIFQSNVVKMYTRPLLVLDAQLLREELTSERARKLELLSRVQQTLQVPNVVEVGKLLSSNPKFAEVLTMFGVAPPMKISKATEKATFAFAKTDAGMVALLEHDDPMVATLAEVRLGTKGSIAETRAERMLEVAPRGPIPMSYTVHGAHTSRLSGGGENLNAQNLPAGRNGQTSNLRRSIMAPPGQQVVVVDSSNLESRVLAYLANSEEKVQAFRDGKDPYVLMASIIYNVGYDALYAAYKAGDAEAKQKRQVAKSCLVEGTLVLTRDRGEVPIEQVTASDKVWDGVEWVSTLGAAYMGERDVITYDGITATPDHVVWTEEHGAIPFGDAAAQSCRLVCTGISGNPVGYGGSTVPGVNKNERVQTCQSKVYGVPGGEVGTPQQFAPGENAGVPVVLAEMRSTSVAATSRRVYAPEMQQPEGQSIHKLWRAWNNIWVSISGRWSRMDNAKSRSEQGSGDRQGRQQRRVQPRKSTLCNPVTELREPTGQQSTVMAPVQAPTPRDKLRRQHTVQPNTQGAFVRSDSRKVLQEVGQTKRRVWDLLNCGPRHRFTASNRLVSNCELGLGFQSGAETFVNYCATVHKVKMDLVTAKGIVDTWRSASANRPVTYMWRQAQDVLTHLYRGDSGTFGGPDGKSLVYDGNRIVLDVRVPGVMLPDGVWINYYELTAEPGKFGGPQYKYKQRKQRGADGPELLLEQYIYGGRMVENLVQGTGAAILKHQLNLVADYYPVVMQTHDEVAFLVPDNPESLAHGLEVAQWAFSQTPDWVAGLPLKGEASHAYRYGDCK